MSGRRNIARRYSRQRYGKHLPAWRPEIPAGPRLALPHQADPTPNRAALSGDRAVRRLARDFLELAAANGGAVDRDLETLGWSKAQLVVHAEAARSRAQAIAEARP